MQAVVIGIAGGSGSGKSTLVDSIVRASEAPCSTLSFDAYYRDQRDVAMADRCKVNYDHPNSLDVERFVADLARLKAGTQVPVPVYDFSNHTRSGDIQIVEPAPVVIVDGILLFVFEEVCELLDLRVFVDVDDRTRTERRVRRDIEERGRTREFAIEQIERTVQPMYGEFVHPSIDRAHTVIDGTADSAMSAANILDELTVSAPLSTR
ncbi:MAG: uridine kinase [Acidimicrobiales bacterium]